MGEPLISPWRAWALAERGRVQLIDVRGRGERELPRVPGARVIPFDELPDELATLDRERPVVFLSGHGGRAAEASGVLRAAGMTAHAVEGGVYAWVEAGLPLRPRNAPGPHAGGPGKGPKAR
jgi:rhodanese-related sulfurtransferase